MRRQLLALVLFLMTGCANERADDARSNGVEEEGSRADEIARGIGAVEAASAGSSAFSDVGNGRGSPPPMRDAGHAERPIVERERSSGSVATARRGVASTSRGAHASAESKFLSDGAVAAGAIDALQDGSGWEDVVRQFENDGLTDPDAHDLHVLMGDWLRTSLARHQLRLSGFGCGKSLCAATVPLTEPDAKARYTTWREMESSNPPMPTPVFAEAESVSPRRGREMRLIISTDPDVAMIRYP